MKFGLALSGGALRGVAHIGALKALYENNLKPSWISGTSAGSMIAALYACGYNPYNMENIALTLDKKIYDIDYWGIIVGAIKWLLGGEFSSEGLIKGKQLEHLMKELTKGIDIKKSLVPLAITAVDINAGKTIMFVSHKQGLEDNKRITYIDNVPIFKAVSASIAIPVVFKPKSINNRRLVDGGVTENVPTNILRKMGANKVIGINLGYSGQRRCDVKNLLEIGSQSLDIMAYQMTKLKTHECDILINPNIYDVGMAEFDRVEDCIKKGYESVKSNISTIKTTIKS